jgi:hypothetical protein
MLSRQPTFTFLEIPKTIPPSYKKTKMEVQMTTGSRLERNFTACSYHVLDQSWDNAYIATLPPTADLHPHIRRLHGVAADLPEPVSSDGDSDDDLPDLEPISDRELDDELAELVSSEEYDEESDDLAADLPELVSDDLPEPIIDYDLVALAADLPELVSNEEDDSDNLAVDLPELIWRLSMLDALALRTKRAC